MANDHRSTSPNVRCHRQAACTYVGLGLLVIILTFVGGLVPSSREGVVWELAVGAVFIIIFALMIYRGWWWLAGLLVLSNTWRTVTYFNDGLGWHIELRTFSVTRIEPQPVAFINAVLMALIVVMLARSAWRGWQSWRQRASV
jgi:hypothetical protein